MLGADINCFYPKQDNGLNLSYVGGAVLLICDDFAEIIDFRRN